MSTAEHMAVDVRAVTDEEIRAYHENGWAMLRGLISRETAGALLAELKTRMGEHAERMNTPANARNLEAFAKWYRLDDESALFHGLRYNEQLGRNSALLMRRHMPIRSLTALAAVKRPASADFDAG